MADPDHVELIRRGIYAVRDWCREHPNGRLDLSDADLAGAEIGGIDLGLDVKGADLHAANVQGADLSHADLHAANLQGADLRRATLWDIDLRDADLRGADLRGANLGHADLQGADLRRANLGNAQLGNANLVRARLTYTDLSGAHLGGTIFGASDLSNILGLNRVEHSSPSHLGTDVLEQTLRGCGGTFSPDAQEFFAAAGVPARLLEYLPALYADNPIQFYSVFVSYAAKDEPKPTHLYADLKAAGVPVWKFDYDALPGDDTREIIDRQIAARDKVVLVCSEQSLDRPWIKREIDRALTKEDELRKTIQERRKADPAFDMDWRVLFPVMLDRYALRGWAPVDVYLKRAVCDRNIADVTDRHGSPGWKSAVAKIVKALDPNSRRLETLVPSARRL